MMTPDEFSQQFTTKINELTNDVLRIIERNLEKGNKTFIVYNLDDETLEDFVIKSAMNRIKEEVKKAGWTFYINDRSEYDDEGRLVEEIGHVITLSTT